jgi:hypothetical protein
MARVGGWEARIGMSGRSTYPFPSSCALQRATILLRGQTSVGPKAEKSKMATVGPSVRRRTKRPSPGSRARGRSLVSFAHSAFTVTYPRPAS